MNKNLTIKQNTDLVLKKSKSTLNITSRILSAKSSLIAQDNNWMERLWNWADNNNISDLIWVDNYDHYKGLSRDKYELLECTELNLYKCELSELPKEIGNLTNLTKLNLGGNKLTELPKEIGNLTNLTWLNLSVNKFTKFPKEVASLLHLRCVSLISNQITTLPVEIGNLIDLRDLDLRNNKLTTLPVEIGNHIKCWPKLKDNPNLKLTKKQKEYINSYWYERKS